MGVGELRVRIVGGQWRGRRIEAPKGMTTRPTTDRVREALFSVITSRLGGSLESVAVLDPFAGSGALGLEALSRGASLAVFVERDRKALAALRNNIAILGAERSSKVLVADAFSLAERHVLEPVSLILLDPPYTLDPAKVAGLLEGLASSGEINDGCVVSWEHAADTEAVWPSGFESSTSKRYGSTRVDVATFEKGSST